MTAHIRIAAAANVEVPAYLALKAKGYTVDRTSTRQDAEIWIARKDGVEIIASTPIELLGIVEVYETRGEDWQASDNEIETFLSEFS